MCTDVHFWPLQVGGEATLSATLAQVLKNRSPIYPRARFQRLGGRPVAAANTRVK